MEPIFNVVLPVFAIILTGYACGRFGVLGAASSEAINKFVYFVALPVLLFFSMARVDPEQIFNWPFLGAFAAGSIITTVIAILFARWVFRTRLSEQAMFGMVAIFGNTGYMGIPLCIVAFGEAGALPAIVATVFQSIIMIPFYAVLIEADLRGEKGLNAAWGVTKSLARNPLMVSSLAGILWSFTGVDLPVSVETFCSILSAAAGPSALFSIGLFMVGKPLFYGFSEIGTVSIFKLLIHPAITYVFFIYVVDAEPLWMAIGILMSALPAGALCFVVAQNYNVYVQRTSAAILFSTLVAVVTLSVLFQSPVMQVSAP
ncbi:MAG: AEC family transporter [Rhodospirillales bacterium]|nr:AEC family transporter [Rhodospirillales bacterium]MBO6788353.1 AEC family transporter [Rhodospirillales bacterium]